MILSHNLFSDFIFGFIAVLILLYTYNRYSFSYWKRHGIFAFPTLPFVGNAIDLIKQKHFFGTEFKIIYDSLKAKGLKYGGYYFFIKPIFVPVDLELIRNILIKDFNHFTDHSVYVNEENEPMSGHLFALRGDKWKLLRKKLNPAFTNPKMKMMFETVLNCTRELPPLIKSMDEEFGVVDIREVMERYTTYAIACCAFGIDSDSLKNPKSEFRLQGKKVLMPNAWNSFKLLVSFLWPKLVHIFKISYIPKSTAHFFEDITTKNVEYRKNNNVSRKDLLHLLIKLQNGEDIGIDEESDALFVDREEPIDNHRMTTIQICAQCFVFFLAGFESSSLTSSFLLYELSLDTSIQEAVRNEIKTVLERYDNEMKYEAIMEMHYLDKCLRETLRKYPVIPIHYRLCTEDYKIPGTNNVIEKGTVAFIPVFAIHRDPEYYPKPNKFDPERFSQEGKAKRPPITWMPFGQGPRTCIGQRFGLLQIKISLIVLLRNYKFSLHPKCKVPFLINSKIPPVLCPEEEILLEVERIV